MIVTVDTVSRSNYGAVIMDAWKHGVEIEKLNDYNLELCCGDDKRIEDLIKRHPSVKILHKEKVKEVTNGTYI